MSPIFAVCVTVMAVAMLAAGWRFFALRSKGFPVAVRTLPNPEGRHWRHGVLICSGTTARLFKLRSLRPVADVQFNRNSTAIMGRRSVNSVEQQIFQEGIHIVEVMAGQQRMELAVPQQVDTALVAWLESCPSERRVLVSKAFRNNR